MNRSVALASTGPISTSWPNGNQTDANGQVIAYITSTHPQTTTISAIVLNEGVTLDQTQVVTFTDVPIQGLDAINDGPTSFGASTTFTATVNQGTSVNYEWDFDDGITGTGNIVAHTYTVDGSYTAVVTASNSINFLTATTQVEINLALTDPDLTITKTGPAEITAGGLIVYDITVTNQGDKPATNVVVTDTLPLSTTFVSSSRAYSHLDESTGQVVWTIDYLPGNSAQTFNLQAQVASDASSPITNEIVTTFAGDDPTPENNEASHTATISPPPSGPDLFVHKTGPANVPAGFPAEYEITIANQGGAAATGIVVTDTLPVSTTFVSSSHPEWNTTYNPGTRNVVFNIGSLAAGKSYKITLQAQVDESAPLGFIYNTVTGTISEVEEDQTNNQAIATTTVLETAPQLTIEPASNGSNAAMLSVLEGSTGSMVITVTNTGTGALVGGLSIPRGNETTDVNYSWLEITPQASTGNIALGDYVTFTVNVTDSNLALGSYYDLFAIESPDDTRVSSEPFFLRVYVHPALVDFTVPVTNTMNNPVPGALVDFTKTSPNDVYVDGNLAPDHQDTYFQRTRTANGSGVASMLQMEAGEYTYEISAAGHQSISGQATIPDDIVNDQFIPEDRLLALPGLEFVPNQAILSVVAGESAYFTVQVRNYGPGHAENFSVTTPADLPWISSGLPYGVTQLLAGETMSVTLFMNPPETGTLDFYTEHITVTAEHVEPGYLAAVIHVLDTPNGSLDFTIAGAAGAPVANARVVVTNQSGRVVDGPNGQEVVYDTKSATTDAAGRVTLTNLPPAEYNYSIDATGYYRESGEVNVQSGSPEQDQNENQVGVQLTADPFTYNWTVEEITINDTYAITVEITYEATVLEPLLYVSHAQFCPGDSNVQYLVANMGPITMTNILLTPNHGGVSFSGAPVNIGDLAPGEKVFGTFDTYTVSGEEAASSGSFNVTAVYQTSTGSANYTTHNSTTKYCPTSGSGGGWSWDWNNGHPVGKYTGSRPSFPGGESPPAPSPTGKEAARLTLSGNAVLERQAFNASLQLDSLSSDVVEDITVNIEARDEDGLAVVNGFAVTPTLPTLLGNLPSGESLLGEWLIVPGDLNITDTNGAVYDIRAQIVYTWYGNVYTTTTVPQPITVYPQPYVRLNYSHTQPDENGDFYVEIAARNDGYGPARNLVLDLSDVTVLADLDGNGRSLLFELKETTIDGTSAGTDLLEYAFRFGDIQPGEQKTGRWLIGVSASDGVELEQQLVTGFKVSCEHLPYQGLTLSPLLNCGETVQSYLTDDCPFCGKNDVNASKGGPINTANGNYDYQQSTPRINTVGNPLQFTWTYNSLNSGINPDYPLLNSSLGQGWTHNYQLVLDLSQVDGPKHAAVVRAPHGTPIYFNVVRDGYEPAPGVHATMTSTEITPNQTVYTVTTASQATYVFTDTGQLWQQIDARGNVLNFTYNEDGQLNQVLEPVSGRFLDFTYDTNGRLTTVSDPLNRATQFGYDSLGHLSVITDTRGYTWTYGYTLLPGDHYLLSRVEDPDGRLVEETGFDNYGRAITQTFRGQDLSIAYLADGRRLITDSLGVETLHVYNMQDLLVATADATQQLNTFVLDGYNNRTYAEDRNGNPTWYDKTPFGYTTAITDALGFATNLEYDAQNNWTRREDGRGEVTLYDYDEHSNLITETNHLGDTVTYTYNDWGQMTSVTDENDATTRYGFDPNGQLTVITNSLGLTSTYEYDAIGRLITSTDVMGRVTVNVYDKGDNLVQVTANVWPGQPQNYLEMYNIVTQYGYDGVGHQVAITDTLGRVNLTLYDEFGRVVTQVVNYDGVTPQNLLCTDFSNPDPEYNICSLTEYDALGRTVATTDSLGRINRTFYDDQGRVVGTINNWSGSITDIASLPTCLALPQNRDHDICTLYGHDAVGNSTVMTDTVGRVTRTFYDSLNRIDGMIMNWDGQTTLDDCLTLPAERDNNVCMRFGYDEVGNTIIITDTLGQMTRTFYDELGRTWATVANWNPATLTSPSQCVLSPDNDSEENICSLTEYDPAGNPTVTTNALGQRNLTVYDDMNRPFIQVTNWDGITTITDSGDCQFPPEEPDTNLCTVTFYDEQNRPTITRDPLGNETEMGYDAAGRVVTTTRTLDGVPVQTVVSYDTTGRRASQTDANGHTTTFIYDSLNRPLVTVSPGGVAITQTYDALGRVLSTTNNLNQVTTMVYDDLDRLIQTQDAEDNITAYEYDVLGNQVAITDANAVRTGYAYDDLNRLVAVVENWDGTSPLLPCPSSPLPDANLCTRYTYDVLGNQVSIVNARNLTSTHITYDSLYRPIVTTDALEHETHVQYNALGARMVITDANGEVTRYQYDNLNRPITITYEADGQTVSYEYNALGSRLTMHDGLGTTRYRYDDLYRLAVVTDTLDAAVGYAYDQVGNRTGITYPGGKAVTYTYDLDNRLDTVTDWNDGLTDYEYDGLGRLITTTLPNGVNAVNRYDDVNHLLSLTYTDAADSLLAEYLYEVDGVGNRQVVTETLLSPEISETLQLYQEINGLLVLEAENGVMTAGSTHNWISQTVQSGYVGDAYLRVLPDVGQRYESNELADSPRQSFSVAITNPADYTVWVHGLAPDAAGDSAYIGLNSNFNDNAALTGFTNQWSWSRQTMSDTQASLPLTSSGVYTLDLAMREDGLRIDRLLLITDTTYIPSGVGPAESAFEIISNTTPAELTSHVIHYTYDDVYRLTDAIYTGDITATYKYAYDPVGNMTAYTETLSTGSGQALGTQTTRVTRYFDDANRLQDAFDYDTGTTSYLYDNNGNLTLIIPPNGDSRLHYGYDQRNLMITHTLSVTGTNPQLQAEFAYDGAGSRVQQVDYTGASPVTTTYVNDIVGLTQVLLADDGAEQVYNLFGLDLISQDEGTNTRYLLADGLGSVRTEMVDGEVESVATYDPYGNLLTQTGNSGTTYGYTGEQYDNATGLLYLRARYYNPALRSFMGRDPWRGNMRQPQSMNGWSYVENSPVNLTDFTGASPELPERMFPDFCKREKNEATYAWCVIKSFGLDEVDAGRYLLYYYTGTSLDKKFDEKMAEIQGGPGCYSGPIPYRAPGFSQGGAIVVNLLGTFSFKELSGEVVYDFAKFEKGHFQFDSYGVSDSFLGGNATGLISEIKGFTNWRSSIGDDYGGLTAAYATGFGLNFFLEFDIPWLGIPVHYAWGRSVSVADRHIRGNSIYVAIGAGADFIPVGEGSISLLDYTLQSKESYLLYDKTVNIQSLISDIVTNNNSDSSLFGVAKDLGWLPIDTQEASWLAFRYAWIYESIKFNSDP